MTSNFRLLSALGLGCALALTGCPGPETPPGTDAGPMLDAPGRDAPAADGATDAPGADVRLPDAGPVCGDGALAGSEVCDDGDADAGDGCAADCTVETGWSCDGASPTACTAICGDGAAVGPETGTNGCDDGGTDPGDGCDATCMVEMGWACAGEPSVCTPDCGDGSIDGAEGCDDTNNVDGDGCSMSCAPEPGFVCAGEPSVCVTACGDGIAAGAEACDDGGTTPGDGCDASCGQEPGWACAGTMPSVCATTCGDGVVVGMEACDDGDTAAGDGCSASCVEEAGWACTGTMPSVCSTSCGDGIVAGIEACDDGDTTPGDGCDGSCTEESGFDCLGSPSVCVPSCPGAAPVVLGCASGTVAGDTSMGSASRTAYPGCTVSTNYAGNEQVFYFAHTGPRADVRIVSSTTGSGDWDLFVLDAGDGSTACTGTLPCVDASREIGGAETVDFTADAGDVYYVIYDRYGTAASTTFDLTVTCAPIVCGDGVLGSGEACDDGGTAAGDGCSSTCTLESGWACTGTPSTCTFLCGNGAVDAAAGETCDDAGTTAGDGCSATCTIETGWSCAGAPSVCAMAAANATCAGAIALGSSGTRTTTALVGGGARPTGTGCGTATGPVLWYEVTVPAGNATTITAVGGTVDTTLQAQDACGAAACLGQVNAFGTAGLETLVLYNTGASDVTRVVAVGATTSTAAGTATITVTSAPTCGNGTTDAAAGETCDDGNTNATDGCSATCQTEPGYLCSGTPSTCVPLAANATCGGAVALGSDASVTTPTVQTGGTRPTGTGCGGGSGRVLWYEITIPAGYTTSFRASGTGIDATLQLVDSCGAAACLASADATLSGGIETLSIANPGASPLTRYVAVGAYGAASTGTFNVVVASVPSTPNAVCSGAVALGSSGTVTTPDIATGGTRPTGTGCGGGTGRVLWYEVTVPVGSATTVTAQGAGIDTTLQVHDACGAAACVASRDAVGSGSMETLVLYNTGSTPLTRLVAVGAYGAAATGTIDVTVSSVVTCPNGTTDVAAGETCDDNNSTAGDGCSPVCQVEAGYVCSGTPSVCTAAAANAECSGAVALGSSASLTTPTVQTGGTRRTGTGCGGGSGRVLWYEVTVPANSRTTISAVGAGIDTTLQILDSCSATACSASADVTLSGGVETLVVRNTGATPISRYVAVGAYGAASTGTFDVTVTTGPLPYTTIPAACVDMTGATTLLATGDDAVTTRAALPFSFPVYGTTMTHFSASTNGFVGLFASDAGTISSSATNATTVPSTSAPNGYLAPFWDDLVLAGTGLRALVSGAPGSQRYTIEWNASLFNVTGSNVVVQLQIVEGGPIEFHYCSATGDAARVGGSSATVATENTAGTVGDAFSINTATLSPGTTGIRWTIP